MEEEKYKIPPQEQEKIIENQIEDKPQRSEAPIHMHEGFEKWLGYAKDWDTNYEHYNKPEIINKLREKSPLSVVILDNIASGRRSLLHRWPDTQYAGLENLGEQLSQLEEWAEQNNCHISKPDTSQLNRLKNRMARFCGGTTKEEMLLWLEDLPAGQKPDSKNIAEYPPVLVPFQNAIKELESQLDQDTITQLTLGEKKPDDLGSEKIAQLIVNARRAGQSTVLLDDCQKILDLSYSIKEYKKNCKLWAEVNNTSGPPDFRVPSLLLSNINEELMINRRAIIPLYIKGKLALTGMNQAIVDDLDVDNLASHSLMIHRILLRGQENPHIILTEEVPAINNPEELYLLFMAFLNRAYIGSKVYARDSKTQVEDIVVKTTTETDSQKSSFTFSYRPEKIVSGVTEFNVDLLPNVFEHWNYATKINEDKVDVTIFSKE